MPGEAFSSQTIILGQLGLDAHHAIDQIPQTKLSRLTNVVRNNVGELTGRPGQTSLLTFGAGATNHHTIGRLNDPLTNSFIRIVGSDTSLAYGTTGALTLIETGFSGNPMQLVPYRPPLSGQTWMFVADAAKMRKVSPAGLGLPIGLPAPGAFNTLPTPGTEQLTVIDRCEAAGWTNNTGTGGGAPSNAVDNVNFKQGTASVQFTTNIGAAPATQYQFWNKANALDLSMVGTLPASDDDIIHLWFRTDRPDLVSEVRLYFVCSSTFNTATLPGTSTANNTEAFVKAFRPNDYTGIFEASNTTIPIASTANSNLQTLQQLGTVTDNRGAAVELVIQQIEPRRSQSLQLGAGRGAWSEFGIIGIPLYRGDFKRIGTDTTRGWQNVTGLVVMVVQAVGAPTNTNVWIDDIYMTGGYGPDTSRVGNTAYDYRYTNYDPRTGAEGNGSPEMAEANAIDSERGLIVVTPNAYGDANIRQRFYRRGGTLKTNWYRVGENTADGAALNDSASDLSIVAAPVLETDNDQPITTVTATGTTVLGSPLPALWGPVQDLLFGCGDPYRPGYLYWCKPGRPDSWPATNNVEVCSSSEQLMAGCVWGGQSFVFSRTRAYGCIPNLSSPGVVTALPTACTHGLVSRSGLCTTPMGMAFVSYDGVYLSQGGAEQSISDADVRGLFHGETRNGYLPVDFSQASAIQLAFYDNELWLTYRDTGGNSRQLVFMMLYNTWRFATFAVPVSSVYGEVTPTGQQLLLGSRANSTTYTHSGTSDAGAAISCTVRTGALDQGFPRQDKLYGDLAVDADRAGITLTVTPYINNEATALAATTITTGAGRQRYLLNAFGNEPQLARNVAIDISWSSVAAPPTLFQLTPSYIVQADRTTQRVTDWSVEGRPTDKFVKGLVIECDTFGVDKTIDLQADGVTQATIAVNASGRRVLQFPAVGSTWTEFRGRLLRLQPTDTDEWILYRYDWIFDEEPYQLLKWETQELSHGIPVHHSLLAANVVLRSTADVTLTIVGTLQPGVTFTDSYTITSTAGLKLKPFVPFNARKAVLWKYTFTSEAPFWLYREESEVIVQPWGGELTVVRAWGSDDLDRVRSMSSASAVAGSDGGGGNQRAR